MTGRASCRLLTSLLCVGLLAVVASGGAAAVPPSDYCEDLGENDRAIVGGVGDTTYTADDDVTLYPGSTLTVVYCIGGEPADEGWLDDGTGIRDVEGDRNTYTVTITGETETVDFATYLDDGDKSSVEDRLVVTVAGGGAEGDDSLNVGNKVIEDTYQGYLRHVSKTENATAALNETTNALNPDEAGLEDANETVYSLQEEYENMTETRAALLAHLRSAGEDGNATGAVAAAEAVDNEYRRTESNATTAVEAYANVVEAETEDPRSTVMLSVFGSLGAAVALGLAAGAAVPLVAARRVKEKMKLSRDVSYDRKTALLPILLGVVAAVAGAVILAVLVGLDPLIRVIA